jgi:hypothetical protein
MSSTASSTSASQSQTAPAPDEITFPPHKLESHFVFFYDLKARILKVGGETREERERTAEGKNFATFKRRSIADSELNLFYFSDGFLARWVRAHLHGTDQTVGRTYIKDGVKFKVHGKDYTFTFPVHPCGVHEHVDSYHFLECTIFESGIIVVVVRLTNDTDITDVDYLEAIARPELLGADREAHPRPGPLVLEVDDLMRKTIEPHLVQCLNTFNLRAVHIDGGRERPVKVRMPEPMDDPEQALSFSPEYPKDMYPGDTVDYDEPPLRTGKAAILHRLLRAAGVVILQRVPRTEKGAILHRAKVSRPYVGTVVDLTMECRDTTHQGTERRLSEELLDKCAVTADDWRVPVQDGKPLRDRVYRFAIAAARTTPWLLAEFSHLKEYWTDKPPRNVYHPGPSIVFIARRGWACLKMESRYDSRAFHLGIVETVLFVLQAVVASFRATRRFIEQVRSRGDGRSLKLNEALSTTSLFMRRRHIHAMAKLLARARLTAPTDDMSILMRSYLTTHTGIASVERIKHLLEYDRQMEDAREVIASYTASLQGADPYWRQVSIYLQALAIVITVTAVVGAWRVWLWVFALLKSIGIV